MKRHSKEGSSWRLTAWNTRWTGRGAGALLCARLPRPCCSSFQLMCYSFPLSRVLPLPVASACARTGMRFQQNEEPEAWTTRFDLWLPRNFLTMGLYVFQALSGYLFLSAGTPLKYMKKRPCTSMKSYPVRPQGLGASSAAVRRII